MSVHAEPAPVRPSFPEPEFEVTGAAHLPFAAAPTMVFTARATEPGGHKLQTLVLSVQVMIDPAKRGYDPDTRARLAELFGPPSDWAACTQGLQWAQLAVVVPAFSGQTTFGIQVPCTYDLEVAASKYLYALDGGEVPLSFHFSGQVFYRDGGGRLQVGPVPWSRTARFEMPVATWKAMIAAHYPGGGWIRLSEQTLRALNERRAALGLASFDQLVTELLSGESDDAR
jgi:Family of unknown function (DUF6084)